MSPRFPLLLAGILLFGGQQMEAAKQRRKLSRLQSAIVGVLHHDRVVGSAVCIRPEGYFVCLNSLVRHIGLGDRTKLLTHDQQKTLGAKLVRRDAKLNLALLKTDPVKGSILGLETQTKLEPTTKLRLVGFRTTTLQEAKIDMLVARVLSNQEPAGFEIDRSAEQVPPGTAVTSNRGRLLGLAYPRAGRVRVAPVATLRKFLATPEIELDMPETIPFADRHQEIPVLAKVVELTGDDRRLSLDLSVSHAEGRTRKVPLRHQRKNVYAARFAPVPTLQTPLRYPVEIGFADGTIRGQITDRTVRIDSKSIPISKLRNLRKSGNLWSVGFRDGASANPKSIQLKDLAVQLGGAEVSVPDRSIEAMTIYEPADHSLLVDYLLHARRDSTVLGTRSGTIRLDKHTPANATTTLRRSMPAARSLGNLAVFAEHERVVPLSERVSNMDVGGHGQYLVFHLQTAREVLVLDALSGIFVGRIPNVPGDALVAAGARKLVLVIPGQSMLQRWSLPDCQRELTRPLPDIGPARKVILGANVNEPILVAGTSARLLNENLEIIPPVEGLIGGQGRHGYSIRVSANGTTFGGVVLGMGPVSYTLMKSVGTAITRENFGSVSHAVRWAQPSADGRLIFSPAGIRDSSTMQSVLPGDLKGCRFSPTVDPAFFLAARFTKAQVSLMLCTTGDRHIIHTLTNFPAMRAEASSRTPGMMPGGAERFHWIPWAGVIVTIPPGEKEVRLRRVDLNRELANANPDYALVRSLPPRFATRGRTFDYQMEIETAKKRPTMKLESAPSGMTVSRRGLIRWDVPPDFKEDRVKIIVALKLGDSEFFHTFGLRIR